MKSLRIIKRWGYIEVGTYDKLRERWREAPGQKRPLTLRDTDRGERNTVYQTQLVYLVYSITSQGHISYHKKKTRKTNETHMEETGGSECLLQLSSLKKEPQKCIHI